MNKFFIVIAIICTTLTGCSGMDTTQQRTLSGGAIGAAAGAGITAITHGNPIWGAIGGAAVGAVTGYVYDQYEKSTQHHYNSSNQATQPASQPNK